LHDFGGAATPLQPRLRSGTGRCPGPASWTSRRGVNPRVWPGPRVNSVKTIPATTITEAGNSYPLQCQCHAGHG
jgi:hypothetical protein